MIGAGEDRAEAQVQDLVMLAFDRGEAAETQSQPAPRPWRRAITQTAPSPRAQPTNSSRSASEL
jgi:hypothetical protein